MRKATKQGINLNKSVCRHKEVIICAGGLTVAFNNINKPTPNSHNLFYMKRISQNCRVGKLAFG